MAAPPGDRLNLNFEDSLAPPAGGSVTLDFTSPTVQPSLVGLGDTSKFGAASIGLKAQFLKPVGWKDSAFPTWPYKTPTIERAASKIFPSPWVDSVMSTPTYVRWRQYLSPIWFMDYGYQIEQVPLVRARYLGGYIPPPGGPNLILNFSEPLVPPPGGLMVLEFGAFGASNILGVTLGQQGGFGTAVLSQAAQIRPPSIASDLAFGATKVEGSVRYIQLNTSIYTMAFGSHTIANAALGITAIGIAPTSAIGSHFIAYRIRYITPAGGNYLAFGTTVIQNWNVWTYPGGIAPPSQTDPANGNRQIPNPWVSFYTRYLVPTGSVHTAYGTPLVSQYVRFVDASNRGIDSMAFGTTIIRFRTSYADLTGFMATLWGSNTIKKQFIVAPTGWASSRFSENAELLINTRRVYVLTGEADQAQYGVANAKNRWTLVNLSGRGISSLEIASPAEKVFNLKRQVVVGPFAENVDPTSWTNFYPFVENKIRYLGTFSHVDSHFPLSHRIYNKGVPVKPDGSDMTLWGAGTFVAYRNRTIQSQGWDSFYTTTYAVVFNDAKVIVPPSLGDTSRFGRPDPVLNLNREVKQHSGWVGPEIGTPFVAFRVRYLLQRPFNDVPWPLHEVRHNPHPIAPVGIPLQGQVGGHELTLFRATISPFSVNVHSVPWVGEPVVQNRNKTVPIFGHDSAEFGRSDIQNYIRYISPVWTDSTGWGNTLIERRTKNVFPVSISVPTISATHRIYKNSPDPPSTQRILLSREDGDGNTLDGNGISPGAMGSTRIRLATIYPSGWTNISNFGTARIWTNNILPPTIFEDALFGIPTLNPPQWVYPQGFATTVADARFPRPRMSPWNIYAPYGDQKPYGYTPTTSQPHVVGGMQSDGYGQSSFPWFGRTDVQHKNRRVTAVGKPSYIQFGTAAFTLRRQYIYPLGTRYVRFGLPVFWGVDQFISLDEEYNHNGIASMSFGAARIAFWVDPNAPRVVRPTGSVLSLWGTPRVKLFNRTVSPTGITHRGNPQENMTSPWGTALVGYPRRYSISMGVQTLWGGHTIDFLNRPVYPVGWINCSLENGNFDDFMYPMRVTRTNPPVQPAGIRSRAVFGTCTVSQRVRTVYSRGVYSYNSGSHSVKASSTIGAQGWESLLIGDIDRWEAGKIKAHGDDMSEVGIPRLLHPLRASSFDSSVVAAPRIAPVVSPVGIPNIAFDGPSVTNPFGCTNRVVSPLPILSNQTVPSPVVA